METVNNRKLGLKKWKHLITENCNQKKWKHISEYVSYNNINKNILYFPDFESQESG